MNILRFRVQQFPSRLPEHFVFASEKTGAGKFDAKVYVTDPTKPVGTIKDGGDGHETDPAPLSALCHDLRQSFG